MRFQCQQGCTRCCDKKGFVYLGETDVVQLAAHLNIPIAAFERRFIYRTKNLRRLRKPKDSQCPFLSKTGCMVHEAKPTQCRTFPFWPELVNDKREWKITAAWCPGIDKGKPVPKQLVQLCCTEMKQAYPTMYDHDDLP